jgi:NADPH:quinone reductase-like Zn-dependent oxidoreductase
MMPVINNCLGVKTLGMPRVEGSMHAIMYDQHGEPGAVLRLGSLPDPAAPLEGQVVVRVTVRPVHPGDLIGVRGRGSDRLAGPSVPGVEGAGLVQSVGPGVTGLAPGTRVAFFPVSQAWSEYVVAPAEFVYPLPDAVSDEVGSSALLNSVTAYELMRAVEEAWADRPGQPYLHTAAGSSIGKLLSSIAEDRGLPLVNLVRSDRGRDALTGQFPSIPVFSTARAGWRDEVRAALHGSASAVLDAVGGDLSGDLLDLLGEGGTLLPYGRLGGPTMSIEALPLIRRHLQIRGVSFTSWLGRPSGERVGDIATIFARMVKRPELFDVAERYDFDAFAAAIEHAERDSKTGTVLLGSALGGAAA